MASKPFDIGTHQFSMKKEAKTFFKDMLARYKNGEVVNDLDTLDLRGLLQHHTDLKEKQSGGIAHFIVDINREFEQTTRSFWIVRPDNSKEDFSFYHCITPKKLSFQV